MFLRLMWAWELWVALAIEEDKQTKSLILNEGDSEKRCIGLLPPGLQALYLPSLETEDRAWSQRQRHQ